MYKNFSDILSKVKGHQSTQKIAVAAAEDIQVIDSLLQAQDEMIAEPVFIGEEAKIRELLRTRDRNPANFNIITATLDVAGQRTVDIVKEGSAQVLMKGMLDTKSFLSPIVKKENNLRTGALISHLAIFEIPNYHKLLMNTDGGMVMYPSLEDKHQIINNATHALHAMGIKTPKHAVLCAVEKVNPKMPESVEAATLQQMNREGIIQGCIVEGPISYDVAMSREIASHKMYISDNVEDFDCMILPNIQAGNILGKCLMVTANSSMAGVVVGTKVPIVMTSRGSDANEKLHSIALAMLIAAGTKQ